MTKKIGVSPTCLSKVERDEFPPMPTWGTYEAGLALSMRLWAARNADPSGHLGDSAPLRRGTPGLLVSLPTEKPPAWPDVGGLLLCWSLYRDCDAGCQTSPGTAPFAS